MVEMDLARWNMAASAIVSRGLRAVQPVVDVKISNGRNDGVTAEQFQRLPPPGWPAAKSLGELRQEVAPYVTPGAGGLGLVVFVERMNKDRHIVYGHFVLFRRHDGEILLHGREKGGLGRGSLNRVYRQALERIAVRAARAVMRSAGTAGA